MFVLTSSQHKVDEYTALGMSAKLGHSTREVLGTMDEVIMYKILSSDAHTLVEDTVLKVDGEIIVDLKFRAKGMKACADASWITSLGYHDDVNLYVYRGIINGRIEVPPDVCISSFEPYFVPQGTDLTLFELRRMGAKSRFSARRIALDAYRNSAPTFVRRILEIPEWEGEYQGEF